MKPYDEKLEAAKTLKKVVDKFIYLTEKVQNEVIHYDTLRLFREVEVLLSEQCKLTQKILE